MKKFITFIIACCMFGLTSLFAQNIQEVSLNANTNGDTIEAPGAGTYIFDDGGNGGSYSGGHDYHLVIKSTCDTLDTVNHMCIVFSYYDIACTDTLYIYDGKSTSAPLLLKINNCYASAPGNQFFISKTNTTGMLTLRLRTTPGNNKPAGFSIHVECNKPCENVTAHIANYYDRTDKYGNIIQRDYLKSLPENLDTIWYYLPGDTVNHTDSIIRIDTTSWIDGALICDGQGIIFHGYGEYTNLTGYYTPHDSTTMFLWTFGTQDTLAQRNATAPLYTKYKEIGCYDVLLSLTDENGCPSMVSPHIQVRLAKNPIKTIFDLAPICNNEFLTVNVGYDGQGFFYDENKAEFIQKGKGVYFVCGKELFVPGLNFNAGVNINDFKDVALLGFAGTSYMIIDESLMAMLEYDNLGKGSDARLNAGFRLWITENFDIDFILRHMTTSDKEKFGCERILKISYQSRF